MVVLAGRTTRVPHRTVKPGSERTSTCGLAGGPPGTRTPNLRIKSPLLCQIELEARRSLATAAAVRGTVGDVCSPAELGIWSATER
jgi:hypothetical protein